MISAQEGIARLKEGNRRFVASIGSHELVDTAWLD